MALAHRPGATFTCTYNLDGDALEIAVQEAADPAAARTYFDAMQALAKGATPIEGLANLGFPAYETADGSAVFQKDNMILNVDASRTVLVSPSSARVRNT